MKKQSGFTLIEVMITVGVLAILATIAFPAYQSQKRKGNRADIISALGRISIEMNRCYSDNGGYTCCTDAVILPKVLNAPPVTDLGHYTITITPNSPGVGLIGCKVAQGFSITATAIGDQANDANCPSFTIDSSGNQTSGAGNASCWSKQ